MRAAARRSLIPWLLLAVIALIAYGSLYPFNFKPGHVSGGLLQALHELTWARADRADRVSNVLLYIPLGFCLFLWFERGLRRSLAALLSILAGAVLSLNIEVAQAYISPRVPSLMDLTLNTVGATLGAWGGVAWRALGRHLQLPRSAGAGRGDRAALVVILLWLAWRLAPYIPQPSLLKLKEALRPLFHPHFSVDATLSYLVYWLVVAQALFAITSEHRGLEVLLALIAVVLAGRLLLVDQAFLPAELLALLLMIPALVVVNQLRPQPRRLLLTSAVLSLAIYDALAPFGFGGSPTRFDFWPFLPWIQQGMPIDAGALFSKLFKFGALLWLLKEAGLSRTLAAGLVTGLALSFEILQLWMPGRTGSVAEPALALSLGLILRYVR
jgi:VanZ family protein